MNNNVVETDEYDRPTYWLYTNTDEVFYKTRVKRVLDVMGDSSGMDILDIGCGDGRTTYELSKHVKSVIGIDSVKRAIDFARLLGKRKNVKYYVKGIDDLTFFKNNQFDVVTCLEVIEHFNPQKIPHFLEDITRILKPNGLFIISTINGDRRTNPNPHHYEEYTIDRLKEIVNPYFNIESVVGVLLAYPLKRYSVLRNIIPFKSLFEWQIRNGLNYPQWSYDVIYKCRPISST